MSDRETLLATINKNLSERKLKTLRKLGDSTKGEIEVTALEAIYDHSARFFTDVKFAVKFPNGNSGAFTVRFNANGEVSDGNVLVVMVNGKFAIVKQWRLPLGIWTHEVPRGFSEKLDSAWAAGKLDTIKVADLPLATLVRELGADVMAGAEVRSITHLGNVAENSGTSAVTPSHFLVDLVCSKAALSKRERQDEDGLCVKLWDASQLRTELGGKINDNHSITAIALALNHLERQAAMVK